MSYFDLKCEGEQAEDGTWTVTVTASRLSFEQAQTFGELSREPLQKLLIEVVNPDQKYEPVVQDLKEKLQ